MCLIVLGMVESFKCYRIINFIPHQTKVKFQSIKLDKKLRCTFILKQKTSFIAKAGLIVLLQRGRDSNPRYPHGYTRFPGVLLQPLGHLSRLIFDLLLQIGVQRKILFAPIPNEWIKYPEFLSRWSFPQQSESSDVFSLHPLKNIVPTKTSI